MRLLLTSAGITTPNINDALVEMLGKPVAESDALCIPTASYGHPMTGPGEAWKLIRAESPGPPCASWAGGPWGCWS